MLQGMETDATCNIQQCWELLANNVASVCTVLKHKKLIITAQISRAPAHTTLLVTKYTLEKCVF